MIGPTLALLLLGSAPPALGALPAALGDGGRTALDLAQALEREGPAETPVYEAEARSVSTWRREVGEDLHPAALAAGAAAFASGRPLVTRCVKLNNYWCIKRAGWTGEIGADEEGHTAFATAEAGADAAVTLLRRYSLDFDRRSALDIVRRWAPAECRVSSPWPAASAPAGSGASTALAGTALAVRGLQNTLRARYLARRAGPRPPARRLAAAPPKILPGPVASPASGPPRPAAPVVSAINAKPATAAAPGARRAARPAVRPSAVPLKPLPALRLPGIMAGLGGPVILSASVSASSDRPVAKPPATAPRPAPRPAATLPALPRVVVASIGQPPLPAPAIPCTADGQRIQNYAARMARAAGRGPSDDLELFDEAGRPGATLLPVLLAMSGVELGLLHASPALIQGAIDRATLRAEVIAPALRPGEGR